LDVKSPSHALIHNPKALRKAKGFINYKDVRAQRLVKGPSHLTGHLPRVYL
jgi:hypothetical protein